MLNENELGKMLSAPGVIALVMAAVRFMLVGKRESPWAVLGFLIGAGYLAYLAGPYMAVNGYTAEEISLVSAAIGFAIPNIFMGLIEFTRKFKDDPIGFIAEIIKRVGKK